MAHVTAEQRKNRRGSYFNCETCGIEFYVFPSYIKKAEAAGRTIRYCGQKCYVRTGDKNPFYQKKHTQVAKERMAAHPNRSRFGRGEDNPNFTRFGVEYGFRGSRAYWWRKHLLETVGKCERCGLPDTRILNLHHIDRNRSNNERHNLELLCWNCHALEHYEAKDGFYHFFAHGKSRGAKVP